MCKSNYQTQRFQLFTNFCAMPFLLRKRFTQRNLWLSSMYTSVYIPDALDSPNANNRHPSQQKLLHAKPQGQPNSQDAIHGIESSFGALVPRGKQKGEEKEKKEGRKKSKPLVIPL